MSNAIAVRNAAAADAPLLQALAAEAPTAPQWSAAAWADVLSADATVQRQTLIAEESETVVGFVVAALVGSVAEIESIAVQESARRRGIARALLEALIEWARARGAQVLELEVRTSNGGAIAFYQAHGFVEQGRRAKYYANPIEDAVLFTRAL